MNKQLTDGQLLLRMVEPEFAERLGEREREVFETWVAESRPLTPKMREWIRDSAERLGIQVAPGKNLFSALSPERQREQLARAARVKLPWEK